MWPDIPVWRPTLCIQICSCRYFITSIKHTVSWLTIFDHNYVGERRREKCPPTSTSVLLQGPTTLNLQTRLNLHLASGFGCRSFQSLAFVVRIWLCWNGYDNFIQDFLPEVFRIHDPFAVYETWWEWNRLTHHDVDLFILNTRSRLHNN